MTNRTCKIGKKARAARRIAAIIMTGTMAGVMGLGVPGIIEVSAAGYSENADYIFEYLTKRLGYNEAAACGIMANIRCESTFNPHAWNAGGGSYGLCQWTGGRYGRLQSWCRSNGYDYTTIDGQLAYLDYELKNYYGSVESHLRSVENTSDGAYNAGQYYCYHFEAPASRGSVSVYRGNLASGTFWGMYRPAEWYEEDGRWRYIKNDGSYHIGWLTIDNKTFYLNQDGNRISGWKTIDGVKYYFDKDGVLASGWVKIDGKNYYFDEQGALITGMVRDGEDWYLLSESGDIKAASEMMEFSEVWIAAAKEAEQTALASAEEGTESSTSVDPSAAGTSNADNSSSESKEDAQEETLASSGTAEDASTGFDGIDGIQAVALAEAGKPADTNHLIPGSDQSAADSGVQGSEETAATAAVDKNDDSETEEAVQTASESVQEEAETAENTDNTAAAADHTGEKDAEADTSVDAEKAEEADTSAAVEESNEADTSVAAEESNETDTSAAAEESNEADTSASAEKSEEADKAVTSEESKGADTSVNGSEKAQKGDTADAIAAADKNAGTADKADDAASEQAQDSSEGASAEQTAKSSTEEAAAEEKQDSSDKAAAEQTGESSAEAVSEDMTAVKVFSEEKISEQAAEDGSTGSTSAKSDEAAAAEALSAAANALNEEDGDEIPAGDSFIIYEPPTVNEESSSGQTGTSRKESSVKITLDYVVPFFDLKDLDNLADILRENDILHAVTKDGVDVTKDVKVTYERIDERSNAYKVIFSVDYKGETTEFETVFYTR